MKRYILIVNPQSANPQIIRNSSGRLRWFASEEEANQYVLEHQLEEYEIYSLAQNAAVT